MSTLKYLQKPRKNIKPWRPLGEGDANFSTTTSLRLRRTVVDNIETRLIDDFVPSTSSTDRVRSAQSHGEGRSNAAPLARRGSQQTFPSASPRRSDRPLAGRVLRRTQCRSSTRDTRGPPSRIVSGRNSPSRAPDVNPLGSNWPSSWRGCPPSRPRVVGDVSQRPREGTASSLCWLRRRDV